MLHKFCNSIMKYIYAYDAGSFPVDSEGKESACNAGDPGLIPGLGRSPREGNGNSLQYSCLENSRDRRVWRTTVNRVAQSWTRLRRLNSSSSRARTGFHGGKETAYNAGDTGSIPRRGRFPAGGNGNPFQFSCLGNPMNRGA